MITIMTIIKGTSHQGPKCMEINLHVSYVFSWQHA